jgi:hypothetical protein
MDLREANIFHWWEYRSWRENVQRRYGWRKEDAVGRVIHNLLLTQFLKPLEEIESELVRNELSEGWLVHTTRDGLWW